MCYNVQPAHNELTLFIQKNSVFFHAFSGRYSGLTLHRKFRRKTLFLVIILVSQESKTDHISINSDPQWSTFKEIVVQKVLKNSEEMPVVEFIFRKAAEDKRSTFVDTSSQLIRLICNATFFFISHKNFSFVFIFMATMPDHF